MFMTSSWLAWFSFHLTPRFTGVAAVLRALGYLRPFASWSRFLRCLDYNTKRQRGQSGVEFHPAISLPCGIFTVATGTYSLVPFFVRIMDSVLGLSPLCKKKGEGKKKEAVLVDCSARGFILLLSPGFCVPGHWGKGELLHSRKPYRWGRCDFPLHY